MSPKRFNHVWVLSELLLLLLKYGYDTEKLVWLASQGAIALLFPDQKKF